MKYSPVSATPRKAVAIIARSISYFILYLGMRFIIKADDNDNKKYLKL